MSWIKLDEYLNSKGKVETGKEDIHGDQVDPMTPPNAPKDGKPYANKDKKSKKCDKGFGDQGDKDLIYEPCKNGKSKKPAQIPTVEFSQLELVPLICESLGQNPQLAENIIRNIKHEGLLGVLVGELVEHRETYKHLAELMGHPSYGEKICNNLARAMHEEVSAPYHSQGTEEALDKDDELQHAGRDDVEVDDEMENLEMEDDEENDLEMEDDDDLSAMANMQKAFMKYK